VCSLLPPPTVLLNNTTATFSVVAAGVPLPTLYQWQVSTDAGVNWNNLANSPFLYQCFHSCNDYR
jgi:hypothetical protein